jgi:hypothetical protein
MEIRYIFMGLLVMVMSACNQNEDVVNLENSVEVEILTKDKFGLKSSDFVQGDDIEIVSTIRNISAVPIELNFSSSKQYDLILKNENKELVWRQSSGMSFAQAQTSYEILAGEEKVFSYTWDQTISDTGDKLPIGNYVLETDDIGINTVASQVITIQ